MVGRAGASLWGEGQGEHQGKEGFPEANSGTLWSSPPGYGQLPRVPQGPRSRGYTGRPGATEVPSLSTVLLRGQRPCFILVSLVSINGALSLPTPHPGHCTHTCVLSPWAPPGRDSLSDGPPPHDLGGLWGALGGCSVPPASPGIWCCSHGAAVTLGGDRRDRTKGARRARGSSQGVCPGHLADAPLSAFLAQSSASPPCIPSSLEGVRVSGPHWGGVCPSSSGGFLQK